MAVKPIPEGFHTLTTQLSLEGAGEAIEFFKKAFGAKEKSRAPDPTGTKIWHAELWIGDAPLFVNDVFPQMGAATPRTASFWMYSTAVDADYKRAVDAGCKVTMPIADMFWGDRTGTVMDPWGNQWTFAQHTRDVSAAEMQKATEEMAQRK
jgi:PhnB protein